MNKKSLMKFSAIGTFFIFIIILFFILIISFSSNAFQLKERYFIGEDIKINLEEYFNYTIKIITPTNTFTRTGNEKSMLFRPEETGNYSIVIISKEKSDSFSFEVIAYPNTSNETISYRNISSNDSVFNLNNNNSTNLINNLSINNTVIKDVVYDNSTQNDLIQGNAEIEKSVFWTKKIKIPSGTLRATFVLPISASNISIYEILRNERKIADLYKINKNKVEINKEGNFEIEYYTSPLIKEEKIISELKKQVNIYSKDNIIYSNVNFHTFVKETLKLKNKNQIRVYSRNNKTDISFNAIDSNNNGFIDTIDFLIPSLLYESYEIIVVTNAVHLDSNKNFISDIYPSIKSLDHIWSETIRSNEYVRVTFEKNLTKENDITIYPKVISGKPKIEVFTNHGTTPIAEFSSVVSNVINKVYLTRLTGTQDTFDLLITGGSLIFDYIIDPFKSVNIPGTIVYGEGTQILPRWRNWTGTDFTLEGSLPTLDASSDHQWIRVESNPRRNETMVAILDDEGEIVVGVINDTSGALIGGAYTTVGTIGTTNDAYRGFDIAFEDVSGQGMILYEKNITADRTIFYRLWGGASFGTEQTLDLNAGVASEAQLFISLKADEGTNNIIFGSEGTSDDISAGMWNGSSFNNVTMITNNAQANQEEDFAVGFEEFSGNGMVIASDAAGSVLNISRLSAGTWSTLGTYGTLGGVSRGIRMCSDPNSNYIGIINLDAGNDVGAYIWDGTQILYYPVRDGSVEAVATLNFDCEWGNTNGQALFMYARVSNGLNLGYFVYNKTENLWYCPTNGQNVSSMANNPGSDGPCDNTNLADDPEAIHFSRAPHGDQILIGAIVTSGAAIDIETFLWNGAALSQPTTAELETGISTSAMEPMDISFKRFGYINRDYPQFSNYNVNKSLLKNNEYVKFNLSVSDSNGIGFVNGNINGASNSFTQGTGNEWYYIWQCTSSDNNVDFTFVESNDTGFGTNYNSTIVSSVSTNCDATLPIIDIISPQNISYKNPLYFNVSLSEVGSWCGYSIDGGANITMTANSSSTGFGAVNNTIVNGPHNVIFTCNDSAGNYNFTSFVSFYVDLVNPTLNLTYPLNTTYNINVSTLNYSYSDSNPGYCWYSNSSGIWNSTNIVSAGTNFTLVTTKEGGNTFTIYCNDSVGNQNSSNVSFYKDTIKPALNFTYPLNITYTINVSTLNYSYSDSNPGFCWYSNSSGIWNSTNIVSAGTNFTFVSTKEGGNIFTIYCNDSLGNTNSSNVSFFKDTIKPVLNLTYPQNTTYITNVSTLNYSYSDSNPGYCWYSNSSGVWNSTNIVPAGTNFTFVTTKEGGNTFTVYCNDTVGNTNSSNVSFYKDTIFPNVQFGFGTLPNNTNISQNFVYANVTINETNFANITYYLYNNTNGATLVNSTNYSSLVYTMNWTNLTDAIYYYNVTVYDIFNQFNFSETRTITLDTNAPNATLLTPQNNSYVNNVTQNYSVNITDNLGIKNATLNIYNSSNSLVNSTNVSFSTGTLVSNVGIIVTLSDGIYKWFYKIFDWAGNSYSTENNTVTIDSYNPLLNITYPMNLTYNINVSVINYTLNDSNPSYCWYSNDSGSSNSSVVSAGTNFTLVTTKEGGNTFTVYCNDSAGNTNSSNVSFFKDTIKPDVNLTYPLNITYTTNVSTLNYSYNDTNPGYCWYSNDSGSSNSSVVSAGTNFTFVSTKEGGNTFTIYCNDTAGNTNSSNVSFYKDTINPAINLTYPLNITYNIDISTLNYSYSDSNPGYCWYSNSSGIWNSTDIVFAGTNFTQVTTREGGNTFTVYCNDSAGNTNSSNVTFIKDTINPSLNLTYPLNITYNINVSTLNYSYVDSNPGYCWYSNSSGIWNSSDIVFAGTNFTLVTTKEGGNTFTIYCNDSVGNTNSSNVSFFKDSISPAVIIIQPQAINYTTSIIQFNVSINEPGNCSYSFDYGFSFFPLIPNASYTGFSYINNSVPEGEYLVTYYCNDSYGNQNNSQSVAFGVDIFYPQISFGYGTENNNTNFSRNSIYVNVTVNETNELNITFYLYNETGLFRNNTYENKIRTINWTDLLDGIYYYNVTIEDIVNRINSTSTNVIRLDVTPPTINTLEESPYLVVKGGNINITANITDNFLGVKNVWVEINNTNYTMSLLSANIYNITLNTSFLDYIYIYNFTVYANDSVNNIVSQTGSFEVIKELNIPVINWVNASPSIVNYGSIINITANVSDDTNVSFVWVEVSDMNYSMTRVGITNVYYNSSVDTAIGIGEFNYTVYSNDTSENFANPNQSSFNITEGLAIFNVSVRAAAPDAVDRNTAPGGKFGVIIYNPTNLSITINNVWINSTGAGNFFLAINASGPQYPAGGWATNAVRLTTWTGTYTLPARSAVGFYVTTQMRSVNQNVSVKYSVNMSGTILFDPHIHYSRGYNANNPFASLAFSDGGTYPAYNVTVNKSTLKTYTITLSEDAGGAQIATDQRLTIDIPDGFTNIVSNGGTGWGTPTIIGQQIIVNTTQTLQATRINYSFNATAPDTPGLYTIRASMWGISARSVLEGAVRVLDNSPPEITLIYPDDWINITSSSIDGFNYSVNDWGDLINCSLYGNWSTGWHNNQTKFSPIDKNINSNFSGVSVAEDSYYSWNIGCYDEFENFGYAPLNRTFSNFNFPDKPILFNISQTNKLGTGNITLFWNSSNHTQLYRIYSSNNLTSFVLLNETSQLNYTDITFSGNKRRFYKISAINPQGENFSSDFFGAHLYNLYQNGNTRNWISFPTNYSYLADANATLNNINNATAFTMWNETIQKRVTCNSYSCPDTIECTDTNCNFSFSTNNGRGYEVNINSSAPSNVNLSAVGIVYNPTRIYFTKNATSYAKNWISLSASTVLRNAKDLLISVPSSEVVSQWNNTLQTSKGYMYSPFPWAPYIGTNFTLNMEDSYEVSVSSTTYWDQT